jgi:hypothetical protein
MWILADSVDPLHQTKDSCGFHKILPDSARFRSRCVWKDKVLILTPILLVVRDLAPVVPTMPV